MRRLALGFVLTFAALALMTFPAQAAPVLSAADQEFLASLAAPAPVLAAKRPIEGKALCSATVNCEDGTSISCSSSVSGTSCSAVNRNCPSTRGSVTCDGITTKCPVCFMDCEPQFEECLGTCGTCGIKTFGCNPYVCICNPCPSTN